jgi:MraZ protein
MDGRCRWGELGSAYRAPLAERPRVSVGGRSGIVLIHFREQGRPQGAAVADQSFPGIVVFPSFKYDALDASGIKRMEEMSARQNTIDEFSDEHENLGMLFADAQALPFDPEGRIILPENLAEYAHITESAAFVGLGKSFQIWEPTRFADHQAMLRERARRQGTRLPPLGGSPERRRE